MVGSSWKNIWKMLSVLLVQKLGSRLYETEFQQNKPHSLPFGIWQISEDDIFLFQLYCWKVHSQVSISDCRVRHKKDIFGKDIYKSWQRQLPQKEIFVNAFLLKLLEIHFFKECTISDKINQMVKFWKNCHYLQIIHNSSLTGKL